MRTNTNSTRNASTKSADNQQRKSFSNNLVILTGNLGADAAFFGAICDDFTNAGVQDKDWWSKLAIRLWNGTPASVRFRSLKTDVLWEETDGMGDGIGVDVQRYLRLRA